MNIPLPDRPGTLITIKVWIKNTIRWMQDPSAPHLDSEKNYIKCKYDRDLL